MRSYRYVITYLLIQATVQMTGRSMFENADRLGAMGSTLCAAHCALLPLLLAAAPAVGAGLAGPHFDQGFMLFATLLGSGSIALGCRRHQRYAIWIPLLCGVLLIGLGTLSEWHDHVIIHAVAMATGGLLIALSHMLNLRYSHAARQQRAVQTSCH